MKRATLLVVFLLGCADEEVTTTWPSLWVNHGQPDSCHGSLTAAVDNGAVFVTWPCGGATYNIVGTVRDYDGALIGRTDDGRPVVGYRQ